MRPEVLQFIVHHSSQLARLKKQDRPFRLCNPAAPPLASCRCRVDITAGMGPKRRPSSFSSAISYPLCPHSVFERLVEKWPHASSFTCPALSGECATGGPAYATKNEDPRTCILPACIKSIQGHLCHGYRRWWPLHVTRPSYGSVPFAGFQVSPFM